MSALGNISQNQSSVEQARFNHMPQCLWKDSGRNTQNLPMAPLQLNRTSQTIPSSHTGGQAGVHCPISKLPDT